MESFAAYAQVAWNVFLVVLGLNLLIIVHEFGHFIVARWCGVRCDKFYIWFDLFGVKLLKFKWGDTEYGLGWLPLGGYVKMYGQEDNPGQARAEMERAKLVSHQAEERTADPSGEHKEKNDVPSKEQIAELEQAVYAPDSYQAKTVPQRMAIILAGVVMNLIFAFLCAAGAYMIGIKEAASMIGGVVPGSPAWKSDLRTGDRIVEINGKPVNTFGSIMTSLIGSEPIHVKIERDNEPKPMEKTIVPWKKPADLNPTIGVFPASTLETIKFRLLQNEIKTEEMALLPPITRQLIADFPDGAEIVRADDRPVKTYHDLVRILNRKIDQPVAIVLNPFSAKPETGTEISAASSKSLTLPPVPMKTIAGLRTVMGKITAVMKGSAAETLGIAEEKNGQGGDILLTIDGVEPDPLRLPYELRLKANSGVASVTATIRKADGTEQEHVLPLIPDAEDAGPAAPLDVVAASTIGIAYKLSETVRLEDGRSGELREVFFQGIKNLRFAGEASFADITGDGVSYHQIGSSIGLPVILLRIMQASAVKPGTKIRLLVGGETIETEVVEASDWFQSDRPLPLMIAQVQSKAKGPLDACGKGFWKTVDSSLFVFKVLRNFGTNVNLKGMGGPVMIVQRAYEIANSGFAIYLMFLCLIGANLAVMNVLPIPILDGGHFMFLCYEAITGKQPNPVVFEILCWIGLLLFVALTVWVCLLDFSLIKRM